MAEGFLKSFDKSLEVYSAGTAPSNQVHPKAVEVMKEENIDLSSHFPESVEVYLNKTFDYVVTVCGGAQESCPSFSGEVKKHIHIGFDDPADAPGTDNEIIMEFKRIRDEIKKDFFEFYNSKLKK